MTINNIRPRSGMRAVLPALFPACTTTVTHGACGERRFGSVDLWLHLIMVDTDDPRAAPPRGLLRGDAASIGSSIARKFPISFSNSIDATPRRVAS
jgi:hypothetical protein